MTFDLTLKSLSPPFGTRDCVNCLPIRSNSPQIAGDDGFMTCMTSSPGTMIHHSTAELAANVIGWLSPPRYPRYFLVITGHGAPGEIETGDGQHGSDLTKEISIQNEEFWSEQLRNVARVLTYPDAIVILISCDTGAGVSGSNLLWNIANILGKPVMARTGITSCSPSQGVHFDTGTWQVAYPGPNPPSPINPSYVRHERSGIRIVDFPISINIDAIVSIEVGVGARRSALRRIEGLEARVVGRKLLTPSQFKISGPPAAFLSATVVIQWANESGKLAATECLIWNKSFVTDTLFTKCLFADEDVLQMLCRE